MVALDLAAQGAAPTLWFGWSGRITREPASVISVRRERSLTCVAVDLSPTQYEGHLNGFSNGTLWPLFHEQAERVRFNPDDLAVYRAVNGVFASRLFPMLRASDRLWVHDYHLIPLGWMLRQAGVEMPLGFYLHVPFPPADRLLTLPWRRKLAEDLAAYDFIGFQTRRDLTNFREFMRHARAGSASRPISARLQREPVSEVLPAGIATRNVMASAASPEVGAQALRFARCLNNRQIIVGADRLDYTKGLLERLNGYERLLSEAPELHRKLCFVQVTAPSRSLVPGYLKLREQQKAATQRINERFGTAGWMPIHDVYGSLGADALGSLFRTGKVGLLTPLRDGMTIAAKEYIAAQNPADPGVLVLSRFAGAAELLSEALLVDPNDPAQIACALRAALSMSLGERQDRWRRMAIKLLHNDARRWHHAFLSGLARAHRIAAADECQIASSAFVNESIPSEQGQRRQPWTFETPAGFPVLRSQASLPWPELAP